MRRFRIIYLPENSDLKLHRDAAEHRERRGGADEADRSSGNRARRLALRVSSLEF
jgi:hypothetical protein